jgi:hypothetical protein
MENFILIQKRKHALLSKCSNKCESKIQKLELNTVFIFNYICHHFLFKGIVQRKLRWVEIGINRRVFFNFKGTPSRISHKTFCCHLSTNY